MTTGTGGSISEVESLNGYIQYYVARLGGVSNRLVPFEFSFTPVPHLRGKRLVLREFGWSPHLREGHEILQAESRFHLVTGTGQSQHTHLSG